MSDTIQFVREKIRKAKHGTKTATLSAAISVLITGSGGTIIATLQNHWQEQNQLEVEKRHQESQRDIYKRLNELERDVAVLKAKQERDYGNKTNSTTGLTYAY